jgi:hypothetical protein
MNITLGENATQINFKIVVLLKIELPFDPAIPLLGIYPKDWSQGRIKAPAHPCLLEHYSQ